jgi:hypothetical protein
MPPDAPAAARRLMPRLLRRAGLTVIWLLLAAVIAVGGAGLVTGLANQPGTPARAELTADGDRAAAPGLAEAQADLSDLADQVARLGELGRGALTALVASDFATLDAAVADGQTLARAIEARSGTIREHLLLLPGTGANEAIVWSPETKARRDLALVALDATGGLEAAWIRLAAGSTTANSLTVLLTDHDRIAGVAAKSGREGKYAAALKSLAEAKAKLDQAKSLRDALANTVDVTTLTQWIDRNAEYDVALGNLYQATIEAKGRITTKLKAAAIAERRAHDLLPANTSGLVIILAEIGRGGLNQAVIGIEQTRAKLQAAVDRLAGPAPGESASPESSAEPGPEEPSPSVNGPLQPASS